MSSLEQRENELSLHQLERVKKFLLFDKLPTREIYIETIIVLGTTQHVDPRSFVDRVDALLEFANRYPKATVIFTGKGPHTSKGIKTLDIEALQMQQLAREKGLRNSCLVELTSQNTKENIHNSLKLQRDTSKLFICSRLMARRVDYYVKKEMESEPNFPYYIVDTDVRQIKQQGFQTYHLENLMYEWKRLPLYRHQGDL